MNIFVLDKDPYIAAQMMCDKHVVKMILEGCQMLSTVHSLDVVQDNKPVLYKPCFHNHRALFGHEHLSQIITG